MAKIELKYTEKKVSEQKEILQNDLNKLKEELAEAKEEIINIKEKLSF